MNYPTNLMTNHRQRALLHLKSFLMAAASWLLLMGIAWSQPTNVDGNLAINSLDGSTIGLYFDQPVNVAQANRTSNYLVYGKGSSGGLATVTNAVLQSDGQTVVLSLANPVGEFFAVAATNVTATSGSSVINATATGYTSDYAAATIGTNNDPNPAGQVVSALQDTFTLTTSGSGIGGTADHCKFVYQQVVGDFDMSVELTRLDNTSANAVAGLMARNSLDAGSPMALVNFTPAAGANQIQISRRTNTNGAAATIISQPNTSSYTWLRMTRSGNAVAFYWGNDGINWPVSFGLTVVLSSTVYVGLTATSFKNGSLTTAAFADFGVTGKRPGDGVVPTLSAALFQTNSVVLRWLRTPRDFAVEVATNLTHNTNVVTGATNFINIAQWNLLNYPILDSTLTGTNAAMPTLGRYMIVPLNLFTNNQLYFRMLQVSRVIPDPPTIVQPGVVLSLGQGLSGYSLAGNVLSGVQVNTATAVSQSGTFLLCPTGHNYLFSTASSGASLRTALQVTSWLNLKVFNDPLLYPVLTAAGSAINYKSQITVSDPAGRGLLGYSFVAAATTAVNPNCPVKVAVYQQ